MAAPFGRVVVEITTPGMTFTVAVALTIPGMLELAVIVVDWLAVTPVTGTFTVEAPCGIVTVGGTVAALVLLELRLTTTPPAGAGPERVRVKFCDPPTPMVRDVGVKLRFAAICTVLESPVKPGTEAVTVTDPKLTPVICAGESGVVAPAEKKIVGVMVSLLVSLLTKLTVTPPDGAGETRVTARGSVWPGATVTLDATVICPNCPTVIGAELLV